MFNDARLFGERGRVVILLVGMIRHAGGEGKIRAGVEWRVNVNQVHLARELGQQRRQHIFLVAPNQPVAPFGLPVLPEKFQRVPPVRRRFIDRLDRLKRQRHAQRRDAVARAVIFAFPNQFRPGDGERVLGLGRRIIGLRHASEINATNVDCKGRVAFGEDSREGRHFIVAGGGCPASHIKFVFRLRPHTARQFRQDFPYVTRKADRDGQAAAERTTIPVQLRERQDFPAHIMGNLHRNDMIHALEEQKISATCREKILELGSVPDVTVNFAVCNRVG